jgi:hypothetical protein
MDAEVSTNTFLTMIIEESVCFMSCEPISFLQLFLCGTHGIFIHFIIEFSGKHFLHPKLVYYYFKVKKKSNFNNAKINLGVNGEVLDDDKHKEEIWIFLY